MGLAQDAVPEGPAPAAAVAVDARAAAAWAPANVPAMVEEPLGREALIAKQKSHLKKTEHRHKGGEKNDTNPDVPGTQRPRSPGLFSCGCCCCCCCPCSCDAGATRACSRCCCPCGCGMGATRGRTCCCCCRPRACCRCSCDCSCCCCSCCRREEPLGGDGGGPVAPEDPWGPAARELPWPAPSEDLWRFAAGSETRVPSPRSSLRRPASPDDAPELLCARLEPAAAALLAAACFPFVVAPDPAALSVA